VLEHTGYEFLGELVAGGHTSEQEGREQNEAHVPAEPSCNGHRRPDQKQCFPTRTRRQELFEPDDEVHLVHGPFDVTLVLQSENDNPRIGCHAVEEVFDRRRGSGLGRVVRSVDVGMAK